MTDHEERWSVPLGSYVTREAHFLVGGGGTGGAGAVGGHHRGLRAAKLVVLRQGAAPDHRHGGDCHWRARGSGIVPLRLETSSGGGAWLRASRNGTGGQTAPVSRRVPGRRP